MRLRRPLIAALAAAGTLLAPQAAQAATITPLKPCYRSVDAVERELVHVEATGFTPGAGVDVLIDGELVARVSALPDGSLVGDVDAPYQDRGERPFTLTLDELGTNANTVSATSRVAALALRLKPRRAEPSRRVRFLGRGFTDGAEVFAHYVRAGKLRKTVSLGAPTGPCGRVDVRRPQIPIKRPKVGRWELQVDNQPTYSATPITVAVTVPITVRRVLRTAP
jgi:hypothetical protein